MTCLIDSRGRHRTVFESVWADLYVSIFPVCEALRQKQHKVIGVKRVHQWTSRGCSSHPARCWCCSSSVLSDERLQVRLWLNGTFILLRSSIMVWRTSSHMTGVFNPARSSKHSDICLMSLFSSLSKHRPSSQLLVFFCFQRRLSWILMTFRCSSAQDG